MSVCLFYIGAGLLLLTAAGAVADAICYFL